LKSINTIAFADQEFDVGFIDEPFSAKVKALKPFHMVARLCNSSKLDEGTADLPFEDQIIKGDPTDASLFRATFSP
jgi:sodium/potassium-transporting ATPase subunit alpha